MRTTAHWKQQKCGSRRTSAVNLDSRPYTEAQHARRCYPATFHAFFRDAQAALAARRGGGKDLKRLALFVETAAYRRPENKMLFWFQQA